MSRSRSATGPAALLELDAFDVTAVDPAALSACAEGLARLFAAIDFALQVVVRRRRVNPPGAEAAPSPAPRAPAALLESAMRTHRTDVLGVSPAFRNRVLVAVPGGGDGGGLGERRAALLADLLAGAGVRSWPMADDVDTAEWAALGGREGPGLLTAPGLVLAALHVTRLPGRPVALGWLAPLLAVATPCDISLHFEPIDGAAAHRAIERRLRALTAERMLDLDRGRIGDPRVEAGLDSAAALRERLARNEARPLRLDITAVAIAADRAAAAHAAVLLRLAGAAAGLRLRHAHLEQAAVLQRTTAGAVGRGGGKLVDSAAAATCLPLTEAVCDDGAGYRLGFARRSGLPVRVDVFDTAQHSNANVAVFATSGHGKSFTLGALIMEASAAGKGALVIDPEGEYERVMHACGGQYLRIGGPGCGALNVFDTAASPEDSVTVAVDLVSVLCGGTLTEPDRAHVDAALREAVVRAQAAGATPLLGDCIARLAISTPHAATVLRRICGEPLGAIFNRPSDVELDADLCAVSLRDLPAEFVPAATLLIAAWMWNRVRSRTRRQHIILDEVGALCVHPPLRDLLVQLARRCRKHGASLVVATQNVEDLLRTSEGAVVATNCAVVLLGGHRAAEAARMERAFGLTASQRRFLEHAGRGEFLLLAGRRRTELRVDLPALHRGVLER